MRQTDKKPTAIQKQLEYWRAYGLAYDPFDDSATGDHCFWSETREDLLQQAMQLACCTHHPVVYYGPEGIGKTRFLQALLARLRDDEQLIVVNLHAGYMTTARQMFAQLAQVFNLSATHLEPAEITVRISEQLQDAGNGHRSLVVLVDDAEQLPAHTLTRLLELSGPANEQINVLLFATSDGLGILRDELQDSAIEQIAIEPFDASALEKYLHFRLELAGGVTDFPFTNADIDKLFRESRGIPRRINDSATQQLRTGKRKPQEPTPPSMQTAMPLQWQPLAVAAGLLVAVGVGVAGLLSGDSGNNHREPAIAVAHRQEVPARNEARDPPPAAAIEQAASGLPAESKPVNKTPEQQANAAKASKDSAPLQPASDPATAKDATPAIDEAAAAATSSATDTPRRSTEREIALRPSSGKHAVPAAAATNDAGSTHTSKAANMQSAEPAGSTQARLAPVKVKQKYKQAERVKLTADERQLLKLPKDSYTLQLLASSSKEGMREFIANNKKIEILLFEDRQEGRPWFVAVTGNYTSVEQARDGLANLPPTLRDLKPWPRQFSSVQESLKR